MNLINPKQNITIPSTKANRKKMKRQWKTVTGKGQNGYMFFFGVEARVLQTKQLNLKAFHQKMLLLVIFFSPLVCVCVFASVPDV